jgi:hypothetical protein
MKNNYVVNTGKGEDSHTEPVEASDYVKQPVIARNQAIYFCLWGVPFQVALHCKSSLHCGLYAAIANAGSVIPFIKKGLIFIINTTDISLPFF